jgi:hypothetical protein
MQTIEAGATRQTLLTVFTTEGGLSTGLKRTFVSQDCPFLRSTWTLGLLEGQIGDKDGQVTLVEGNEDVIVKISPPYLPYSVMD